MNREKLTQVLPAGGEALRKLGFSRERDPRVRRRLFSWRMFVLILLVTVALYAAGVILDNGLQILGFLFCTVSLIVQNNRMMTYVEARAFDGSGRQ